MNTHRIAGAAVAAALLLAALPLAAQDAVTLKHTYKKGDSGRYKIASKGQVQGVEFELNIVGKREVASVADNGDVELVESQEEAHLTVAGAEQEVPKGPPTHYRRDRLGKLIEYKVEGGQGDGFMSPEVSRLVSSLEDVLLTDKPVKAGDSWETELENPASPANKVKVTSTYVGTETVNGKMLWKLTQKAEAVADAQGTKLTAELTTLQDPETGGMVKEEIKLLHIPTQFGLADWASTVERLPADAK